jgi:crotonobetainyl-CoA:carnitine CoA-transferase CaiB-like acyl-CoA transferase
VAKHNGESFDRPRLDRMQERLTATYGLYEAADGWVCVAAITDDDWAGLAELFAGKLSDPRFATREGRAANDAELGKILATEFKKCTTAEWGEIFEKENIAAEVTNPDFGKRLHDDPEMVKRGWVVSFDHPEVGRLDQIGDGFSLSKTPGVIQGRPLIVGEATREILAELGYSEDEIDALKEQNVVSTWKPGETHKVFINKKWFPNEGAKEKNVS